MGPGPDLKFFISEESVSIVTASFVSTGRCVSFPGKLLIGVSVRAVV